MKRVSIIVPCYNEEKTIALLLQAVYDQTASHAEIEVIISDGQSQDGTRQAISRFQQAHPDLEIRVLDNSRRNIPAALNTALAGARGEYIVRLDAHSEPDSDYVERCLADLQAGKGAMVGGVWLIQPGSDNWIARSIAAAAAHPLGVGDALYRFTSQAGFVDTVPFGAFRRDLLDQVGKYDETLLTNEDYEFNTRIRQAGGKIWLDPAIRSKYYARKDLAALARQYWRYGFWKFQMLRRYPGTLRWRQALPPLFVLSVLSITFLAVFWDLARLALALELLLYFGILVVGALRVARSRQDLRYLVGVPLAIACMHMAWGGGFLGSVVKSIFGWNPSRQP